jgi:hypothetical protein
MFSMSLLSFKTISTSVDVLGIIFIVVLFPPISFAYHGLEVSVSLDSAQYIPLGEEGNQINVFVNYTVNDSSLLNQRINSVMKVYTTNGTLIKTSSSSDGFTLNQSGSQRHATTINNNNSLQNVNVIPVIQFTNLTKTTPLSNPLQFNLTLSEGPVTPEIETGNEIAALKP